MDLGSIALYSVGFIVLIVVTQDLHIFPGAFTSKAKWFWQRNKPLPRRIESIFVPSLDGVSLEVWRYAPEVESRFSNYVAVVFHGNGGPVENFLFIQMWFAELGIISYSFDYRGFGRSGGWPSESGIYRDSDAVWEYVRKRENLSPERLVVVGVSVGSAPAARIASLHEPKLLLLSSAFTDLKNAVMAQPLVGLLAPFVWYKFPTQEFIARIRSSHVVLAHGLRDTIVPPSHSILLEKAYMGSGRVLRFAAEGTGHNMAFYALKDELKRAVESLLRE